MIRATVADVLAGTRQPHELDPELHDLWRDGFRSGCNRMQATVYRLDAECDRLYYELHNPAQVRAEHERMLAEFQVAMNRKVTAEKWAALDRVAAERAEAAAHG